MPRSVVAALVSAGLLVAGVQPAVAASAGANSSWTDAQRRAHGQQLHAAPADVTLTGATKVTGTSSPAAGLQNAATPSVVWPSAGVVHLRSSQVTPGRATVGGLPVSVAPVRASGVSTAASPAQAVGVDVQVLDHAAATAAGVDGVLLSVAGESASGQVGLSVGYAGFAGAYGGDWASRLRLVSLPACVLTTPAEPSCRTQTPVTSSVNDTKAATVSGTVAAASGVVALASVASSGAGSWAATPLSASSSWAVDKQTGDFTWSYPFTVPPTQGGPTPQLALSYDAGSLDGRIASTNNQTSWVGDGWDLSTGFVERKYVSCADDATGNANNVGHKTGDLCWGTDNATLVLAGHSSDLVKDAATGTWRLKDDDGTTVQHLTGAWNGDNDTEYWVVTTRDGTSYYFGRDKRSASDTLALNSAWTVPVYGNNPGEPCYQATFATSWCNQAWRWNLDYVVDASGNTMTYVYTTETNSYGRNANTAVSSYVRGGYLTRIDYGQRAGSETSAPAPQQVTFTVAERCLPSGSVTCDPAQITTSPSSWPDVPGDLICTSSTTCPNVTSPAFFTRKRLTGVSTAVYVSGAYQPVDSWALAHKFPSPGDGSNAVLWLDSIQHTGSAGTAVTLPAVSFTGVQLTNRVDTSGNLGPRMIRYRVSAITSETGAITTVNYTPTDCTTSSLPASPDSDTRRCFPVVWYPEGASTPVTEYFNKYLTASVVQDALDGASLPIETRYTYTGDPAWHYDDSVLTPVNQRTWGQWRGYGTVDVTTGATTSTQLHTRHRFFRGMNGDHLANGSTRSVAVDSIADAPRLNGFERETITYDGSAVVDDTVATPWTATTATAADGTIASYRATAVTQTTTTAPALSGGTRVTRTSTTYDATLGVPTQIEDAGDVSTTSDDRCTRLTYASNATANLTVVTRAETVAVACAGTPSRPGDVIGDELTFYDGASTLTATPTRGLVTSTQVVSGYSGGNPTYVTTASTTYDANGRTLTSTDALGNTTTTVYTPSSGGPTTQVAVTSPDPDGTGPGTAATVTTVVDPRRGLATSVTDENGKVTSTTYDGLGRRLSVRLPGGTVDASTYSYTVGAHNNTVTTNTLGADGSTYLTSVTIYDALGRQRQVQTPGANRNATTTVVSDTMYDSRGLVTTVVDGWATAGAPSTTLLQPTSAVPSRTRYTYDGAGRVTTAAYDVDQVQKWATTTTYGGDRTSVVPPAGGTPTTTVVDARGNTTSLVSYTAGTLSGASQTVTYGYDKAGRLTTTKDAAGNTWTSTYDLRGHLLSATDPDKGTTTSTYDDADRVVTTTDARGQTLWFGYDNLGRKVAERSGSATGTLQAAWVYDTVAKGRLTSSTRYMAGAAYTTAVTGYDSAYQPTGQSLTLPSVEGKLAGTYTVGYTYTGDEQLATTALAATGNLPAETVSTYYDALSVPEWMSGGFGKGVYVAESAYTSFGDLESLDLNTTSSDYLSYTYQEGTRRLATQTFQRESASGYDQDRAYSYDDAGDVTKIDDQPTAVGTSRDTQCFGYDGLRRLVRAWTPAAGDCTTTPSVAGLGGAASYWTDYAYDTSGDRTSSVSHATAGTTTATSTYPTVGSAQAHAVSSVATSGPSGATSTSLGYDAAGNLTSRVTSGQAAQSLVWDVEGKLSQVSAGSTTVESNVYSADGDRLIRRGASSVTAYLPGGQELTLTTATGALTGVRYYTFAGRTIAVRTGVGLSAVTVLVPDPQGTAQIAVSAVDDSITRRWTDPFGATRGTTTGTWTGERTFLGKVNDQATGLIAVGARYYDPTLGRFVSVDPVLDLGSPQTWSGYAYAGDNPVTWSDPSGLFTWSSAWHAVTHAASAAGRWVNNHQAVIAGFAVGVVAGAACEAFTVGIGSIGCGFIAGAIAGAVTNLWASKVTHTQQFSWTSLGRDILLGGISGAVGGALGGAAVKGVKALAQTEAGAAAKTALAGVGKALASRAGTALRAATNKITNLASTTAKTVLRSNETNGTETAGGVAETFFRTMSKENFAGLQATGRVSATSETFVSRSAEVSSAYDGQMVQFSVRPGTMNALASMGVRDDSAAASSAFPNMPLVSKGWTSTSAYFKGEGGVVNIGLGRGSALNTFNDSILSWQAVP